MGVSAKDEMRMHDQSWSDQLVFEDLYVAKPGEIRTARRLRSWPDWDCQGRPVSCGQLRGAQVPRVRCAVYRTPNAKLAGSGQSIVGLSINFGHYLRRNRPAGNKVRRSVTGSRVKPRIAPVSAVVLAYGQL